MKSTLLLRAFSFLILLTLCNKISFSQDSKIIAEIHNLLVDNSAKDKIIQIRFLNCSKSEFEVLYKKALQSNSMQAFRQAYSSENLTGSIHFSKSTEITTGDVKVLLNELNVHNAFFDEKKVLASDLTKYQFSKREKLNQNERTEK